MSDKPAQFDDVNTVTITTALYDKLKRDSDNLGHTMDQLLEALKLGRICMHCGGKFDDQTK